MVTKDLAKLSELHYKVDKYGKKKATKRINKKLEGTDYKLETLIWFLQGSRYSTYLIKV